MKKLIFALLCLSIAVACNSDDNSGPIPNEQIIDDPIIGDPTVPLNLPISAPCVDGMAGDFPCSNVDLIYRIDLETFQANTGNDSWGWTDPTTGTEYAIMGLNNGTAFVDLSDPTAPIYLGKLATQSTAAAWRDVKVYTTMHLS